MSLWLDMLGASVRMVDTKSFAAVRIAEAGMQHAETLFLWTTDNPVHDVETARQSAAKVKGAQLYVMRADAAHWPQYAAPEEFNTVVRRFLAEGQLLGATG